MTHVKLHRQDGEYLMVLADEVDAHGDWLAASVQSFGTLHQLKEALRGIVATGETIAVQGTNHFERLANELGLRPLATNWGNL